jgi:hypothetical protein
MLQKLIAFNNAQKLTTPWLLAILLATLFTVPTYAQYQPQPPQKPTASKSPDDAYNWTYRAGLTCGGGASTSTVATKPTMQCGALFGIGIFDLETGVMGPQANRSPVSGYLSTNLVAPLFPKLSSKLHGLPLAVGGYTRMFETGHALDYGLAYARSTGDGHSIQFEVRDYWAFANPSQHNVVFRIVWLVGLPD